VNALRHAVFLAVRHLRHHRGRSLLIGLALFLVAFLPIAVDGLVDAGERSLRSRGDSTPMVAGAPGAPIDLVLAALYFRTPPRDRMRMGEIDALVEGGLAAVLPLVLGDRVKSAPLVGVDPDYVDLRGLRPERGRGFAVAGECVLGAAVAARTGLDVDDRVTTEPREMFDLAGAYPLRMRVVGVLARSDGPDDEAVFTSLETAWIVQGLAHGHDDLETETDPSLVMGRTDDVVVGTAKVREFVEITDENRASFHFHGPLAERPVDAAIVVPIDARAGTILMGRADAGRLPVQLVVASEVVDRLLVEVFRVRRILLAVLAAVGVGTVLLVAVVIALSIRIRATEIETMHLVGCGRGRVPLILGTEVAVLVGLAIGAAVVAGRLVAIAMPAVERLLLG
jgi:putative ABC transport system permease protein